MKTARGRAPCLPKNRKSCCSANGENTDTYMKIIMRRRVPDARSRPTTAFPAAAPPSAATACTTGEVSWHCLLSRSPVTQSRQLFSLIRPKFCSMESIRKPSYPVFSDRDKKECLRWQAYTVLSSYTKKIPAVLLAGIFCYSDSACRIPTKINTPRRSAMKKREPLLGLPFSKQVKHKASRKVADHVLYIQQYYSIKCNQCKDFNKYSFS